MKHAGATLPDASNGFIKDVPVCIFSSSLLGYANNTCDGSNYSITSDATGHAFKFSIPQDTFYILGKSKVGDQTIIVKRSIPVTDHIVYDTLRFQLEVANGLRFTTQDAAGKTHPGCGYMHLYQ